MYPRFIERRLKESLSDTRVVLISGPRQSGKTTLAEKIAAGNMAFLTLEDETTLDSARRDPVGFIQGLDRAVIDEVQRAPEVLLAIKRSVDSDKRPGRFLLTGSANLMTLPQVADSLAGRMEFIDLLPLSQCEMHGAPGNLLDRAFEDERGEFVAWLALHPEIGDVIKGSGGCRKVRWSRPGTGKRGGVRVIHYNRLTDGVIYLLVMYAKGVKDSIPAKTLNTIRETIDG